METYQIWHNPRCSKSRQALTLLEEKGLEVEVIKYMDTLKSAAEIKEVLQKLGMTARELMRITEDDYKNLNLKNEEDEDTLIEAMSTHPKLIQRAIVIKGDKAVLGRPPEKVLELI